jgi:chromate transport protein ChrA
LPSAIAKISHVRYDFIKEAPTRHQEEGSAMSNQRTFFRIMRAVGLLTFLALCLWSEWMFMHGNPANALQWKIHLYAIASVLLVPFGWVPLVLIIVGHVGKWRIDRRIKKAAAEQTA